MSHPIKGYRELSPEEVAQVNEIKAEGARLEALVSKIRTSDFAPDPRCLALAVTNLQQGLMWLTRAVTRPEGF